MENHLANVQPSAWETLTSVTPGGRLLLEAATSISDEPGVVLLTESG